MTKKQRKAVEYKIMELNGIHGKGMVTAVVWGIPYAGVDQTLNGIVVRQMQYGMDAVKFAVSVENFDHSRIGLTFLNRKLAVE